MNEVLEHFSDVKDRTRTHPFGVFLESIFPVPLCEEFFVAEVIEQLIDVFSVDDLAQAYISRIRRRYHHQDVVGTDTEEVEAFEFSRNQPIGYFFNYSNPVIRVNNLVANLKLIHMAMKYSVHCSGRTIEGSRQ